MSVEEVPLSLPLVVLKEIFHHIPTSDILYNCRQVSKSWNQYANSICRNRHVRVKPLGDFNSVSDYCITDVFKSETDLPWSAVLLRFTGVSDFDNQKFCGQISEIYGNHRILNVSLDITYEDKQDVWLEFLADQGNFKISELRLHETLSDTTGDRFKPLERFLGNCIGLHSLCLVNFDVFSSDRPTPVSNLFQVPTLVDLKTLQIQVNTNFYFDEIPYNPDPQFPVVNFNLLKSTDFPNLETVHLTSDAPTFLLEFDIRKIFEPAKPFESVKNLYLSNHDGSDGKFSTIFPNVAKIKVIIQDSKQLGPILDGMDHLTELDLTLFSFSDNNNTLLYLSYPFIQSLTKLEKLTLQSHEDYEQTPLDASGLIVLQLLPPLNLIIYASEVQETDRCITFLRACHPRLQLLQK